MTNKKYTDEEIKIALANCAFSAYNPDACRECHYNNVGAPTCVASCTNDALELIYRQASEIERLQKEVNLVSIQFQDLQERTDEIKSKAYKEFADIVKKNIKEVWNYDNGTCSCVHVLTKDIDKILKEMIGEE